MAASKIKTLWHGDGHIYNTDKCETITFPCVIHMVYLVLVVFFLFRSSSLSYCLRIIVSYCRNMTRNEFDVIQSSFGWCLQRIWKVVLRIFVGISRALCTVTCYHCVLCWFFLFHPVIFLLFFLLISFDFVFLRFSEWLLHSSIYCLGSYVFGSVCCFHLLNCFPRHANVALTFAQTNNRGRSEWRLLVFSGLLMVHSVCTMSIVQSIDSKEQIL